MVLSKWRLNKSLLVTIYESHGRIVWLKVVIVKHYRQQNNELNFVEIPQNQVLLLLLSIMPTMSTELPLKNSA